MEDLEKLEKLREKFTLIGPDGSSYPAHKWRVQSASEFGTICVPYIDARQVSQRLTDVFGVDGWSNTIEETASGEYLICTITAGNVRKSDVGTPSNTEKKKGMASDALKRAAVHFGIGAYLYEMQPVKLKSKNHQGKYYPCTENGEILWTGGAVTSYINMMSPLRTKLIEIYYSLSDEKKISLNDKIKELWESIK